MKKIRFISLFCLSIFAISGSVIALSSCTKQNQNTVQYYEINLDSKNLKLNSYTSDEWKNIIHNQSSEINALLSLVQTEMRTKTNNENYSLSKNISISNIFINYKNVTNPTYSNVEFSIINWNDNIKVNLNNLYTFSSSYFQPPKKFVYNYNQTDLSRIENIHYTEITDAQWTNAINEVTNGEYYIIPSDIYVLSRKKLLNNIYTLTYTIDQNYQQQISELPNANSFKNIDVNITLSPYIGKELQTTFELDIAQTSKIFPSKTLDDVKDVMTEAEVYNALNQYVNSLETIQPLRDCIDPTNPNIVTNMNRISNILGTQKKLKIQFESNIKYIKKYVYIFYLSF